MAEMKMIGVLLPPELREALNQSNVFRRHYSISNAVREIIQTYLEKAEGYTFSDNIKVEMGRKLKER